jgi:hypothetical protein
VILTEEQIVDAIHRARRFSGAYTGTSGTLASYVLHLVDTVRHLQEGKKMLRDDNRAPGTSPAEQLLEVAQATVRQRRATYGPPGEHFARTVAMVNGLLGDRLRSPLTAADWAQIMILDKLARHQGESKTADTTVDLAGYAACLAECEAAG